MQDLGSPTRDRILAPRVEAWILNQWTTGEVPINSILLVSTCVCSGMSDSLQPSLDCQYHKQVRLKALSTRIFQKYPHIKFRFDLNAFKSLIKDSIRVL